MPRQLRLTPAEGEKLLLAHGFKLTRSHGSHRMYQNDKRRVVIPYHAGEMLHPKVVKQIMKAIGK